MVLKLNDHVPTEILPFDLTALRAAAWEGSSTRHNGCGAGLRVGLAVCEALGKRLVRSTGNDAPVFRKSEFSLAPSGQIRPSMQA